jgi:hypothetical protein
LPQRVAEHVAADGARKRGRHIQPGHARATFQVEPPVWLSHWVCAILHNHVGQRFARCYK